MTCDRVEVINNPRAALESEASAVCKATLLTVRPTRGDICCESSHLPPSSTSPDLGGSQIEAILPPHPPSILKVTLSLNHHPYWSRPIDMHCSRLRSQCCSLGAGGWSGKGHDPLKPGTEEGSSWWFLPHMCLLPHGLDPVILSVGFRP